MIGVDQCARFAILPQGHVVAAKARQRDQAFIPPGAHLGETHTHGLAAGARHFRLEAVSSRGVGHGEAQQRFPPARFQRHIQSGVGPLLRQQGADQISDGVLPRFLPEPGGGPSAAQIAHKAGGHARAVVPLGVQGAVRVRQQGHVGVRLGIHPDIARQFRQFLPGKQRGLGADHRLNGALHRVFHLLQQGIGSHQVGQIGNSGRLGEPASGGIRYFLQHVAVRRPAHGKGGDSHAHLRQLPNHGHEIVIAGAAVGKEDDVLFFRALKGGKLIHRLGEGLGVHGTADQAHAGYGGDDLVPVRGRAQGRQHVGLVGKGNDPCVIVVVQQADAFDGPQLGHFDGPPEIAVHDDPRLAHGGGIVNEQQQGHRIGAFHILHLDGNRQEFFDLRIVEMAVSEGVFPAGEQHAAAEAGHVFRQRRPGGGDHGLRVHVHQNHQAVLAQAGGVGWQILGGANIHLEALAFQQGGQGRAFPARAVHQQNLRAGRHVYAGGQHVVLRPPVLLGFHLGPEHVHPGPGGRRLDGVFRCARTDVQAVGVHLLVIVVQRQLDGRGGAGPHRHRRLDRLSQGCFAGQGQAVDLDLAAQAPWIVGQRVDPGALAGEGRRLLLGAAVGFQAVGEQDEPPPDVLREQRVRLGQGRRQIGHVPLEGIGGSQRRGISC